MRKAECNVDADVVMSSDLSKTFLILWRARADFYDEELKLYEH